MSTDFADDVTDGEMDHLEREPNMLRQRVIAPKLAIGAGVLARPARGIGDGVIGLRIDRRPR